jgi:hypothetical protein
MILVLRAAYAARAWQEHTQQMLSCLVFFGLFCYFYLSPDPRLLNLLTTLHLEPKARL